MACARAWEGGAGRRAGLAADSAFYNCHYWTIAAIQAPEGPLGSPTANNFLCICFALASSLRPVETYAGDFMFVRRN